MNSLFLSLPLKEKVRLVAGLLVSATVFVLVLAAIFVGLAFAHKVLLIILSFFGLILLAIIAIILVFAFILWKTYHA